ncbi:MAG: MFS transporter [Deltaproteobacteria bacterium]|nr:MFS transporter [Deltaproteobacteria bacterium]MBT4526462.1 MFS transporter [Deltaproteobacteria bacterium]
MHLIFIVLSQFFSGSIWFAGNVTYANQEFLLSAVQFGFIFGTLFFAFLNISDRFSPVKVFFTCSLLGAFFNYSGIYLGEHEWLLLISRMLCGITLSGIYPVGMKIAVSWYPETIGKVLGWLVGALVLATGLPYLIKIIDWQGNAQIILQSTSILCIAGGFIQLLLVGDGPHLPKGSKFDAGVIKEVFRHRGFRAATFGYFGHMWELYAVWAFIPLLFYTLVPEQVEIWSFAFFVAGFLGCSMGGIWSLKIGSRQVALWALFASGLFCLVSPFLNQLPIYLALFLTMVWGIAITGDSPQLSSLNAKFAPRAYVGSALTIVNCIGFLITIVTIELLAFWIEYFGIRFAFLPLALGPLFGWVSLKNKSDVK